MPDINSYNYQQIHDKKLAASICVAATVKVISFNLKKMTVDVQPLSKHLENGKYKSQPPILDIPISCTRCGGFIFRPWFKEGDIGVVLYLDHDMDSTVTGGKEAIPLTERNHATTDAIFVGAIVSGNYAVKGLPDESLALATEDGNIGIAITKDKVVLVNNGTTAGFSADNIELNAKNVSISASGTINIQGTTVNIGFVNLI